MFDHPLFTLFFDVTANNGWNITAWFIWLLIAFMLFGAVFDLLTKEK
jgi:hypothetical protein